MVCKLNHIHIIIETEVLLDLISSVTLKEADDVDKI